MKRRWKWELLTRDRVCVLCGSTVPAASKAIISHHHGKITLCRECRLAAASRLNIDQDSYEGCEPIEG